VKYSTRMDWTGREWTVTLFCGASIVAEMSLDDWANLGATAGLVEDAAREAAHEARLQELGDPDGLDTIATRH
jgi:hypothetical protein